jgi:hypothetical protein
MKILGRQYYWGTRGLSGGASGDGDRSEEVIIVVEIILVELEAHKIVTNEEVGQWKFKSWEKSRCTVPSQSISYLPPQSILSIGISVTLFTKMKS